METATFGKNLSDMASFYASMRSFFQMYSYRDLLLRCHECAIISLKSQYYKRFMGFLGLNGNITNSNCTLLKFYKICFYLAKKLSWKRSYCCCIELLLKNKGDSLLPPCGHLAKTTQSRWAGSPAWHIWQLQSRESHCSCLAADLIKWVQDWTVKAETSLSYISTCICLYIKRRNTYICTMYTFHYYYYYYISQISCWCCCISWIISTS